MRNLHKIFSVPEREAGLRAAVRSLVQRRRRLVLALSDLSFDLRPGEVVGFLGPNGAGKSTTLKILAGVLVPTGGEVRVLGHVPFRRERDYLRSISLLMGNRRQLQWDLPAADSFELIRVIYGVPLSDFRRVRETLVDLLDAGELLTKPVRNLSLGERMKVEFIGALLHTPKVLFLDEPTLGLDPTMQKRIREFVAAYCRDTGATIMLTSHYMADIEALCARVLIIDRGGLLFDDTLARLRERFATYRDIEFTASPGSDAVHSGMTRTTGDRARIRVPVGDVGGFVKELADRQVITDLTIAEPPVEDLVERLLAERVDSGAR